MVEFLVVVAFAAVVAYGVYYMLNRKEAIGLFDLNKDGQVNKADAEVVVKKAKKNVTKAVGKAKTASKPKATTKKTK
jgi:hypothetical protein